MLAIAIAIFWDSTFPKLARGVPWFSSLFAKTKGCNPLQLALQFFRPCFPNFSSRSDVNGLGQRKVFFLKNKKQTSLLRASEQGHPWTNHLLQDFCSQGLVPFFLYLYGLQDVISHAGRSSKITTLNSLYPTTGLRPKHSPDKSLSNRRNYFLALKNQQPCMLCDVSPLFVSTQ